MRQPLDQVLQVFVNFGLGNDHNLEASLCLELAFVQLTGAPVLIFFHQGHVLLLGCISEASFVEDQGAWEDLVIFDVGGEIGVEISYHDSNRLTFTQTVDDHVSHFVEKLFFGHASQSHLNLFFVKFKKAVLILKEYREVSLLVVDNHVLSACFNLFVRKFFEWDFGPRFCRLYHLYLLIVTNHMLTFILKN